MVQPWWLSLQRLWAASGSPLPNSRTVGSWQGTGRWASGAESLVPTHGPTRVFSPQSSALQHSQKRCPMAVTHSEGLLGPPPLVALAVLALLGGLVYLCTLCAACRRYVPGDAVCFRAAPHTQIPAEALVCTEGGGLHPKKLVPAGGEAVVVTLCVGVEWMDIGWVNVGAMLGGCLQDAGGVLRVPGHWSCAPSCARAPSSTASTAVWWRGRGWVWGEGCRAIPNGAGSSSQATARLPPLSPTSPTATAGERRSLQTA